MITNLRVAVFMFATFLVSGGYGQTPKTPLPANSNLMCIEKLEMPSYPLLAQQARISGTVTVDVVLSTTGSVQDVNVRDEPNPPRAGDGVLRTPVFEAIRGAVFDRSCGGKTVNLVFVFELSGTSIGSPKQTVAFGSPNRFWIKIEAPHFQP